MAPALEPGACAPDCSTIIESKYLALAAPFDIQAFQPDPIAFVDSLCEPGYKAMFAYADQRMATTEPWVTVGSIDWPVQPYTAYFNPNDELIWVTDDVTLLGIRDGAHQPPITAWKTCGGLGCIEPDIVTGLDENGTTSPDRNCQQWTNWVFPTAYDWGQLATLSYTFGSWGLQRHAPHRRRPDPLLVRRAVTGFDPCTEATPRNRGSA